MSRAAIILPILLGIIVVLWGCSPYQSTSTSFSDKALEARVEKLEKELKAAKQQHTLALADLKTEQGKRLAVEQELEAIAKERDSLRIQIKVRGDELAKAQSDLIGLRDGLKELLGKADAALVPLAGSNAVVSVK